jgi:hypothetical protein
MTKKYQITEVDRVLEQVKQGPYWCENTDENGNKVEMSKVEGSRIMSKEEVEELNNIKLPF